MSAELPPLENNLQPNQENAEEKIEEKNINTEPGENQVNSDFLNIYKSFDLTPFEQIIINKLLPYGIKIETEEILLKKDEKKKKGYLHRKHKKNFGNSNNILENILDNNENNIDMNLENNNNNIEKLPKRRRKKSNSSHNTENKDNNNKSQIVMRRMTREHKPKIIEDLGYIDKDIIKGKSNPLFRAVNKVCEKGLLKIKKIQYYSFFYNYNSSKQNELSLSQIEKNIREYKYQSIYEFIMDLRKLWNFFLKMFETQNEIKEKVCEMARKSEQLYCELESINIEKVELEDLNKKVDNLEKKLREIKGSGINIGSAFNLKKNNMSERSMSLNEKTVIKNNIKLLTIEQKKGIADILRDTIDTENKKIDINVEKLKQDLSDMNQRENNEIENDIEKDSISESDDSSISDSY